MGGLCEDLAAWRRIGADNDTLIASNISTAFVRQDVALLAKMLSELPAHARLPAPCEAALGPTTDRELNACPAMRQEFRYSLAAFDGPRLPGETTLRERIVLRTVDRRQLIARSALQSAVFCTPRALSQARADHSLHAMAVAEPATCSAFRVAIDPFGCLLVEIRGEDPLSRYVDRRIDQAAALSLLRTVIWLRRQPGGPDAWPLALERRPGSLGLRRAPRLSPDGKLVSISLLYAGKGERLALPIGPPGAD